MEASRNRLAKLELACDRGQSLDFNLYGYWYSLLWRVLSQITDIECIGTGWINPHPGRDQAFNEVSFAAFSLAFSFALPTGTPAIPGRGDRADRRCAAGGEESAEAPVILKKMAKRISQEPKTVPQLHEPPGTGGFRSQPPVGGGWNVIFEIQPFTSGKIPAKPRPI